MKRTLLAVMILWPIFLFGAEPAPIPNIAKPDNDLMKGFAVAMHNGRFMAFLVPPAPPSKPSNANQVLTNVWGTANTAGHNALAIIIGSGSGGGSSYPTNADQVLTSVWNSSNNALAVYCVSGCVSGTVTSVTFTGDGVVDSSTPSSAVTTSGTLTATLNTQSALSWFGNATGSTAAPAFNTSAVPITMGGTGQTTAANAWTALVQNPSATTLGGVESLAAVSHKWINTISTSGVPSATQPASTDLSDYGSFPGAAFGSQTANYIYAAPNGSSGNPTFRAMVGADMPTPTASANGAIPIALFGTSGYGTATAEMTAVAQNSVKGFSVYLGPDYIEASNLVYDVTTADNTANVYDLGLYGPGCNAGATSVPLVAHTGPTAGTTLAPSIGVRKIAFSASNVIFAPGWYCFAVTSSAASPALILGGSIQASGMPIVYFPAGASIAGTTTSGTLNSTATAPATSVGFNGPANAFMQIYQ